MAVDGKDKPRRLYKNAFCARDRVAWRMALCSARDHPALLIDQSRLSLFSDFPPHISSLSRVLPLSFIQTRSLLFAGSDVESFFPFVLEESMKFYLQSHVFFYCLALSRILV